MPNHTPAHTLALRGGVHTKNVIEQGTHTITHTGNNTHMAEI